PSARRNRTRGGNGANRSSLLSYTSTTRSPLRTRARSPLISTSAAVAPLSSRALQGVSVIEAPRVERTRAPLSPQASTLRTSPPSRTVKPVLLPMKVATSAHFRQWSAGPHERLGRRGCAGPPDEYISVPPFRDAHRVDSPSKRFAKRFANLPST